jgi:hypothetical protein
MVHNRVFADAIISQQTNKRAGLFAEIAERWAFGVGEKAAPDYPAAAARAAQSKISLRATK